MLIHLSALALTMLSLSHVPLRAQELLREVRLREHVPSIRDIRDLASGDIDGDGDLDLVLATGGQDRVLRNDGHALFEDLTHRALSAAPDPSLRVLLVDIDSDGDLDLVRALESAPVQLHTNDGTGIFSPKSSYLPAITNTASSDILAVDLDGDKDKDLVIRARSGNDTLLWFNNGQGRFTDLTASRSPTPQQAWGYVRAADVDGDGDMDLVRAFANPTPIELWLNDGTGSFRVAAPAWMPTTLQATTDFRFVDFDRDGDQDIVLASHAPGPALSVYVNDKQQHFVDSPNLAVGPKGGILSITCVDANGDQDLDLALGMSAGPNRLMINTGKGWILAQGKTFGSTDDITAAGTAADFDGDGRPEVLFGNRFGAQLELWLNSGTLGFFSGTDQNIQSVKARVSTLTLGDIDRDGDPDLALHNNASAGVQVVGTQIFRNNGRGRFDLDTSALNKKFTGNASSLKFADIDKDGDLDLLIAATNGPTVLYQQAPTGQFMLAPGTQMPTHRGLSTGIAMGDLDGDGDLDGFVSHAGGWRNLLMFNTGAGVFREIPLPITREGSLAVALGDIDGDGDLDAVFGNQGTNRIYKNEGKGRFSVHPLSPNQSETYGVALTDIDGDGDLDVFAANSSVGINGQNRLFQNDGKGVFLDVTAFRLPSVQDRSLDVAVADIDLDGDQDFIVANLAPSPASVLLNDGLGSFTIAIGIPSSLGQTTALAVADIDRDGDDDVMAPVADLSYPRMYTNMTRQLTAPVIGRTGQPFVFRCYRLPHNSSSPAPFATPLLGLALWPQPLPLLQLGFLHLSPALMTPLSMIPLNHLGYAEVRFQLPNHATLIGLTFYMQAFFGGSQTGPFHLSNAVESRIVY